MELTNNMMSLCVRQFQVISVFDLKLKWRKVGEWLVDYFKISPDVWAFDELREYVEREVQHGKC